MGVLTVPELHYIDGSASVRQIDVRGMRRPRQPIASGADAHNISSRFRDGSLTAARGTAQAWINQTMSRAHSSPARTPTANASCRSTPPARTAPPTHARVAIPSRWRAPPSNAENKVDHTAPLQRDRYPTRRVIGRNSARSGATTSPASGRHGAAYSTCSWPDRPRRRTNCSSGVSRARSARPRAGLRPSAPRGIDRRQYSQGWRRSKNSVFATIASNSADWSASSGGGAFCSPSRAAVSSVK